MKKLLINILLITTLITGISPQPIEAVGKKSAIAAIAVVGGVFGFRATQVLARRAKIVKKSLKELSREEREKLSREEINRLLKEERELEIEEQKKADERFGKLFKFVHARCNIHSGIEGLDPTSLNAHSIFERDWHVLEHISEEDRADWDSKISLNPFGESGRKKIVKEFKAYCTKKRKASIFIYRGDGEKYVRAGYERVEDMVGAYLEYLNQPTISKKDLAIVAGGVTLVASHAVNNFMDFPAKIGRLIKRWWPF